MYFWSVSLVYQLSGQFLISLVDQKKSLVDQKKFWYTKKKFWYTKKKFGRPKKYLVYQKKICSTKKMRNRPDNWYTKETDQKYMDAAIRRPIGPWENFVKLLNYISCDISGS